MHPGKTLLRIGLLVCLSTTGLLPALAARQPSLVRPLTEEAASADTLEVDVDGADYEAMMLRPRVLLRGFPLPRREPVDLQLTAFDPAPGARFVVVDDSGEREVPRPEFRAFRGSVVGDPQGAVTLNLFDGRIAGFVRTSDGEFTIAPGPPGERRSRIRRAAADPDRPDAPFCGTDALAPIAVETPEVSASPPVAAGAIDGSSVLVAGVAIDATYEWYDHFGSLAPAQNYILNIMAQVTAIYESEVNVETQVSYLRVFTTPADPYNNTTNTSVLLSNLRSEWINNQGGVDRTAAHLFSHRPSGGAGVAYVGGLCSTSFGYAVSTMSALGASWERSLVAHELGHNFGSPHTHCYSPEIDQCANEQGCYSGPTQETVGTIMSYCNVSDPVFHSRVEDETVRPGAEAAYPTCMELQATEPPPTPQNVQVH